MISCGDGGLGLRGFLDEVVEGHGVRQVLVQVILEHLNVVHFLSHEVVLSNSWEAEGLVEEFPGVHHWGFLAKFFGDEHGVIVVLDIKRSGEVFHLVLHLFLGDFERWIASFTVALG